MELKKIILWLIMNGFRQLWFISLSIMLLIPILNLYIYREIHSNTNMIVMKNSYWKDLH